MPLSSLSKYAAYMALALNLAACSFLSPSSSVSPWGLLIGDKSPFEVPLPINTEPKRMALGSMFTVGVKADGTVWTWGNGTEGELGMGKKEVRSIPKAIPNMTDFVEVAAGSRHVLALRKDGTVWSWGNNEKGALGYKEDGVPWGIPPKISFDPYQLTPKQIPDLKDIVSVAAGSDISLALSKEGDLYVFGTGNYILGFKTIQAVPKIVFHQTDAVRVVARGADTALLTKKGELLLWSDLGYWLGTYKIQNNDVARRQGNSLPWLAKTPLPVADIAFGSTVHNVLLQDGSVWVAGASSYAMLGIGSFSQPDGLSKVSTIGRITRLQPAMALDEKGVVWQWGGAVFSDFGYFDGMNGSAETWPIRRIKNQHVVDIYADYLGNAYLRDDGSVWFYGDNFNTRGTGVEWTGKQHDPKKWKNPERSLWTWK